MTAVLSLQVTPLDAGLGATVSGIDLSQPLDDATAEALREAWFDHSVLVFHGQSLSDEQLLAFTRLFGELEYPPSKLLNYSKGSGQQSDVPVEINVISNVRENGKPIGQLGNAEAHWHSDTAFVERPPAASVLHAWELPPSGGNTHFLNMYRAYEALPDETKARIDGLRCKHDQSHTSDGVLRYDYELKDDVSQYPGAWHPLVRTHPGSGRKALYLGRRLNAYIEGLSVPDSEALLDELWDAAVQEDFIYEHVWSPGDVLMWDNRCVTHRRDAFPADQRRIMHRAQTQGEVPV